MSKCKICGAKARSEYCFRHKPKKPLKRSPIKKKPTKKRAPRKKTAPGEKTLRALKKDLWTIFSKFIRLRDSDENGYCTCITCPNKEWWKYMDAAHYIPRRYTATFVHEQNSNSSCKTCNQYLDGNLDEYTIAIDRKYGAGTADKLKALKTTTKIYTRDELLESIDYYTKAVKALLEEKNLK